MNELAVVRGDLRARFGTGKGVGVQAVFALLVCLATLLGLSPDADGATPSQVVGGVSIAILVAAAYVAVAISSGEIAIPGEKTLPDLVMSPFSAGEIVRGKAITSAVFAAHLALATWPAFYFLNALRDGSPWVAAAQAGVVAAVVWGFAAIGTWLSGAVEGDLVRSLAAWGLLAGVFGLLPLLGFPSFQPVRAVHPGVAGELRAMCALFSTVIGALAFWGSARRIPYLRAET